MISDISEVREGRLTWPEHKPRAVGRLNGPFKAPSIDRAIIAIKAEMRRWDAWDFVISRNSQRMFAGDPGVAVWWVQKRAHDNVAPDLRVLACDQYTSQGANAHAIALTLEAMRALERWGAYTAEEASEGARIALPPPADMATIDWRAVLGGIAGVAGADALDIVNARYRRLAANAGQDQDELRRLNLAIELARKEFNQ